MRCKNCGSENDSNLYICQNCGSPLYDENETVDNAGDATQVFDTVGASSTQKAIDDFNESQNRRREPRYERPEPPEKKDSNNKQIAIIVILVIILIAVITATVIAIVHAKGGLNNTTSTTISTTEETTEETTEYTTEETTTSSTTKKEYIVSLIANDGGNVDGEGSYEEGKTITVKATPWDGYEFRGWYKDGALESSDRKYTFKVRRDVKLRAKFAKKEVTKTTTESTKEVPSEEPDVDIVE